jgi:hypothetical protein
MSISFSKNWSESLKIVFIFIIHPVLLLSKRIARVTRVVVALEWQHLSFYLLNSKLYIVFLIQLSWLFLIQVIYYF